MAVTQASPKAPQRKVCRSTGLLNFEMVYFHAVCLQIAQVVSISNQIVLLAFIRTGEDVQGAYRVDV